MQQERTTSNSFVTNVFSRILKPIDLNQYLKSFIQAESLFIEGAADKFDFIIDQQGIFDAIWRAYASTNQRQFKLSALEPDELTGETQVSRDISPDQIETFLSREIPICINDLGAGDSALRRLESAIGEELGLPGSVRFNCYISRNSAITRTHIDTRATHSIQVLGAKTWDYATSPALAWPRSTAQIKTSGEGYWMMPGIGLEEWEKLDAIDQTQLNRVTLSQGDFLFVPAGAWHQVTSKGDSIAINISIKPPSFPTLISTILQYEIMENPEWRAGLPPGDCVTQADALEDMLTSAIFALKKYVPNGKLDNSQ